MLVIQLLLLIVFLSKWRVDAFTRGQNGPRMWQSLPHIGLERGKAVHDRRWLSALRDDLEIGSQLLGEVYDHDVNFKDPRILFNVKGKSGENMVGSLSTRNLSWQERMMLQIGAMMQVYVIGKDKDELKLSLVSPLNASSGGQGEGNNRRSDNAPQCNSGATRSNPAKKIPTRLNKKMGSMTLKGDNVLLNTLKTGMKLEGTITSCTPYAVFVDAGVIRAGKGGTFVSVNGILHKNDMPFDTIVRSSNNRRSKNREIDEYEEVDESVMSKGKRVTVYVKEVYKNSGRISYSLDAKIEKSQILEEKEKNKAEGNERRRARRMRRILEEIAVGDTVVGTVNRVIAEGVLVSMEIEGASLPVIGLLSKKDLPMQFQVPPDLKDSFQKQLLEQDFMPGREVTCGVYRVNSKSNSRMKYNLKLTFEEFGAVPNDNVDIPESALESFGAAEATGADAGTAITSSSMKREDDFCLDSDDEEAAWEDSDTREIYNELRGEKSKVVVTDLFDWADVQDMIADGDITVNQINSAIQEVTGSTSKTFLMSFPQFAEVVSIMQDALHKTSGKMSSSGLSAAEERALLEKYLAVDDDEDEDKDEDTDVDALPSAEAVSASIEESENYNDAAEDEEDFIFDESMVKGIEDEALEEVAREIFDDLAEGSSTIGFEVVRAWGDIEDMIANDFVSEGDLTDVWASLKTDEVNFEQFFILVQKLEDVAAENEEANSRVTTVEKTSLVLDEEEEYDEIDEEAEEEMLGEIFAELSKGKKTITLTTLKKWDDLAELQLESKHILELLTVAGVKINEKTGRVSGGISREQFVTFVRTLDEAEDMVDEDVDVEDSVLAIDEDGSQVLELGDYGSEEPLTEDENKEILESLFNQLRGSSQYVSSEAFLAWDDVRDLIKEGLLEEENVHILMQEVGCDSISGSLDLEQFSQLVTLLDETLEALEGEHLNDPSDPMLPQIDDNNDIDDDEDFKMAYNSKWGVEDGTDELHEGDQMTDAQVEALAKNIFDELRGNAKSLPIKKFKKWEEVQQLIVSDIVQVETIDALIKAVTNDEKKSTLTFAQFMQLVELLDEAGEAMNYGSSHSSDMTVLDAVADNNGNGFIPTSKEFLEDEEEDDDYELKPEEVEAIALEVFDELKSEKTGKLSVKKFLQWESVKEAIENGELSKGALNAAIAEVDTDGKGNFIFSQFVRVMELIEDAIDAHYDRLDTSETNEDKEEEMRFSSGQGFAKAAIEVAQRTSQKAAKEDASLGADDVDSISRTIFDELRGRKTTLDVDTFKEWEDCRDMIENGQLKRSTLERAIKKVGALETGEMSFSQFSQVIDIIQKDIDQADLMGAISVDEGDEDDDINLIASSKRGGTVMAVSDNDGDSVYNDDDSDSFDMEYEPISEEEELASIYDELRGSKDTLPLVDFLKWEDVQELLDMGAVTKDALAESIEKVGITVENGDLTKEQFCDLVQLLDGLVDQSKLLGEEGKGTVDLDDFDGAFMDEEENGLMIPKVEGGDQTALDASLDMLLGEDSEQEAEEVVEMFQDLSKGKEEISQKQLRKWDELQELVDAGLTSKATIDRYIDMLDLAEDEGVTFSKFQQFIGYLDRVLLDEGGALLAGEDEDEENA